MNVEPGRYIEPIAICGMAMRLPGGIKTAEAYWDLLLNGRDMRAPIPISRYNIKGFDGSLGKTNTIQQDHAYFLEDDLAAFDASLFTMTKNELEKADPQQRLLLLVVRECLESAGVTDYRGSLTGFFVGTFSEDWLQMQTREEQHATGYVLTGHLDPMLANRVAFEYDLRGPAFVVKTACSSSMIALHNAVRSIQNRDCNAAIVSGSNLNMGPITTASMTQEGIMSPEGSIVAQEALMRKAYSDAGLDPAMTAMVECHGTGTPVGDPIEAISVGNVFGGHKGIYIGSVKPNLGHSEASAGISSLIKAILALENKTIPPNIKFEIPNAQIPFEEKKITVPIKPMPWPQGKALRISVNSFGIGGTNAHCIVESAEQYAQELSSSRLGCELAIVSANSQDSLKAAIENLKQYVSTHSDCLPDLCYTLSRRREFFKWRSFAVLSDPAGVAFAPPTNKPVKAPSVVMVFSGQGAQWPRMGHELITSLPGFKQDVLEIDEILQSLGDYRPPWRAIDELSKPTGSSQLARAELAQPLSTVVQIGLVNALKRLGVRLEAVVGHSSGEIAAAYAAEGLTLREAIACAYFRGYVSKSAKTPGGMAAIGLGAELTKKFLPDRVVVACENSPTSTTISGDADQIEVALKSIRAAQPDTFARVLKVEMAYHSHHMMALSERYRSCLDHEFTRLDQGQETPEDGQVHYQLRAPFFSSVRGKKITNSLEIGPQYWIDNLTSPVIFNSAVRSVLNEIKNPLFLEIGPHSTLQGPIREICSSHNSNFSYVPTMLRSKDCTKSFLSAVGQLYQQNINVNFASLYPSGKVLTNLPAYPWSLKDSFWYEPRVSREWRLRPYGHHEILGRKVAESTSLNPSWRVLLVPDHVPWILDHKVREDAVMSFAGFVSVAGEAVRQLTGIGVGYKIKNARVNTALVIGNTPKEIVTALRQQSESDYYHFSIASHNGSTWIAHCEGLVRAIDQGPPGAQHRSGLPRIADAHRWFKTFAKVGFNYGPRFQLLEGLRAATTTNTASASVHTSEFD
ncbi:acyl transferase domain-containing protein [Xylaria scruposa]|nr:acyl transferase domain-containing protein [Xylaria scruposa]